MSRENVGLLREITERLNRKDIPGVLRLMDPEIRFEHRVAELEGTLTGVDAVRDWFADVAQHFHDWKIDCDDFRDLGDRVLALGTSGRSGRRAGSKPRCPTRSWPSRGTVS